MTTEDIQSGKTYRGKNGVEREVLHMSRDSVFVMQMFGNKRYTYTIPMENFTKWALEEVQDANS